MSVSLIGAALIFFACTAIGFSASSVCLRRLSELEAFLALIAHIGAEIRGYLTPLERIYASFENEHLRDNGFLDALRQNGGVRAIKSRGDTLFLTADERRELERFFAELGSRDAEGEAKHCAYFEKRFAEYADAARGEIKGQRRLYGTLGMLAGIMLAVILI